MAMSKILLDKAREILAHPKHASALGLKAAGSTPMTEPNVSTSAHIPVGYCSLCGGGYWLRKNPDAVFQCGRCQPSESRVETVFVPGGTMPPLAAPSTFEPAPEGIQIEPAAPNARPVYWETGSGRILGPAIPEFLARDSSTFWISTTFKGQIRWINADRLRSRKAFLEQLEVREVELIRPL
jgi:hypothetical protein